MDKLIKFLLAFEGQFYKYKIFMTDDLSESISQLQSWLMSVDDNNINEISISILNSVFINSEYSIHLANSLYTAIDYRPLKITLYAQVLLLINNENKAIFPLLKPYFLKNCFSDYEKKKCRLFFLHSCYENGLLDIEDVKYCFTHPNPPDESLEHSFNSLYFFCWFAPELEKEDAPFYEITKQWFFEASKIIRCFPEDLVYFCKNFKELKKNDWKKMRKMRRNNASHLKMLEVLKDDDIDIFEMLQGESDFNWEQRIESSIYDVHWIINESASLFEYSAYFGSVKCFKFIYSNYIQNNPKIDPINENSFNVVHYAIAGGNIEIVRFLHSNDYDFNGALNISALFHRNDIFDWVLNVLEMSIKKSVFGWYGSVINYAIKSFNTYVIDIILNEKTNKKSGNDEKFRIFQFAVENCQIETIKFLLNRIDFNLLTKSYSDISILYFPIIRNKVEMVKFFISKEPQLINSRSGFELPIWTAAKYGRTEIVEFLGSQPGIYKICNKRTFRDDPYEDCQLPFGITTNVFEFCKSQAKRRLELIKERNPFFVGIG